MGSEKGSSTGIRIDSVLAQTKSMNSHNTNRGKSNEEEEE
jgi:hypothetical protein